MEDILRKIKLIDDTSIRLNLTRQEFISELRNNVEEANIDTIFSGAFEVFSSNKKKYKGEVDSRGFYIRKKRKLFEKNRGTIKAKGTFKTNGDILVVDTTISAYSLNKLIFSTLALICYVIFISYQEGDIGFFEEIISDIPIAFFFIMIAILGFIWFSLKREVAKMKQDLEKYFHLITSKVNN